MFLDELLQLWVLGSIDVYYCSKECQKLGSLIIVHVSQAVAEA